MLDTFCTLFYTLQGEGEGGVRDVTFQCTHGRLNSFFVSVRSSVQEETENSGNFDTVYWACPRSWRDLSLSFLLTLTRGREERMPVFYPVKKLLHSGKCVLFTVILLIGAVAVYRQLLAVKAWSDLSECAVTRGGRYWEFWF